MDKSPAINIRFRSIYNIGDLVLLNDSTEQAYITEFNESDSEEDNGIDRCTIRYDIDNRFEYNVDMRKLKLIPVLSGGGTRSGTTLSRDSLPPTLPTNHERYNETYTVSSRVEEQNTTQLQQDNEVLETNNHLFSKMKSAFVDSYQFFSQKNSNSTTLSQLPLYEFLRDGKDRGKGWLKSVISPKSIKKGLDQTQGLIYLLMMCFFRNIDGRSTVGCFGHGALLCNAFGVGREHGKKFFNRVVSNDFKFERKQRTDTGMSVFNCEKKRRHAFTAFNTFKKRD